MEIIKEFTEKLRKLLKKYPKLPAAAPLSGWKYEDALDCDIGYVYDSSSRAFKEKAIVISAAGKDK